MSSSNIEQIMNKKTRWFDTPVEHQLPYDVVYAIGDVHGMDHLLAEQHRNVERSSSVRETVAVIHLGDLIDRGPCSFAALKRALDYERRNTDTITLPGNHEQFMIDALINGDDQVAVTWLLNGGYKLLQEIGVVPDSTRWENEFLNEPWGLVSRSPTIMSEARTIMAEYLDRVLELPTAVVLGNLIFVHAGIPPHMAPREVVDFPWVTEGTPVGGRQAGASPLWVRDPFLKRNAPWEDGSLVVHGHTAMNEPEITPTRISIDTGAFHPAGYLTMAEFRNNKVRFHIVRESNFNE